MAFRGVLCNAIAGGIVGGSVLAALVYDVI
jgi:hypothetical protein